MTATLNVTLEERIPETGTERAVEVTVDPDSGESGATGGERHLALCLDTSGSMRWELDSATEDDTSKMEKLKSGVETALEGQLDDDDYVSLVAFSGEAETVVPIENWGEVDGQQFWEEVHDLDPSGTTDIFGALEHAHEELRKQRADDAVRRILLLTDGKHNPSSGDENPDFEQLASDIDESGTSIMAAGVGSNYDQQLMKTLADASQGNWHHLETEEAFRSFVENELDRMGDVGAVSPDLVVDLTPGFDAHEFNRRVGGQSQPGSETWEDGNTTAVVPLGDLVADEHQSVTFNLIAPPRDPGFETTAAELRLRQDGRTVEDADAEVEYIGALGPGTDPEPGVITPRGGAERSKLEDKYEERIAGAETEDEFDEIESELEEEVKGEFPDLYDELTETLEKARSGNAGGVLARKPDTLAKKDD